MNLCNMAMIDFDLAGNAFLYSFEKEDGEVVIKEKTYTYAEFKKYFSYMKNKEVDPDSIWNHKSLCEEMVYKGDDMLSFVYRAFPGGIMEKKKIVEVLNSFWEEIEEAIVGDILLTEIRSKSNSKEEAAIKSRVDSYVRLVKDAIKAFNDRYKVNMSLDLSEGECKERIARVLRMCNDMKGVYSLTFVTHTQDEDGDIYLHFQRFKEEYEEGSLIKEIVIPESEYMRKGCSQILRSRFFNNVFWDNHYDMAYNFWVENRANIIDCDISFSEFLLSEVELILDTHDINEVPIYDEIYRSMQGLPGLALNRFTFFDMTENAFYMYYFKNVNGNILIERHKYGSIVMSSLRNNLGGHRSYSNASYDCRYAFPDLGMMEPSLIETLDKEDLLPLIKKKHPFMGSYESVILYMFHEMLTAVNKRYFNRYVDSWNRHYFTNEIISEEFNSKDKFNDWKYFSDFVFYKYEPEAETGASRLVSYKIMGFTDDGKLKIEYVKQEGLSEAEGETEMLPEEFLKIGFTQIEDRRDRYDIHYFDAKKDKLCRALNKTAM